MDKTGSRKKEVHPEQLDVVSLGQKSVSLDLASTSSTEDLSLSAPHPGPTVFSVYSDEFSDNLTTQHEVTVRRRKVEPALFGPNGQLGGYQDEVPTRLRHLAEAFRARTQKFRQKLDLPLTPSTAGSKVGHPVHPPPLTDRPGDGDQETKDAPIPCWKKLWARIKNLKPSGSLNPEGYNYIYWLSVVVTCFLYNIWVVPLRATFPYQTSENLPYWLAADYLCDFIYLLDLVLFRPRIQYLEQGIWITDPKLTRANYVKTEEFKMDLVSLLPLDLLYFAFGFSAVLVRFPRMFKFQAFNDLYDRLDSKVPYPVMVRVGRAIVYMLWMIHINGCMYYAFSAWEGIGTNNWTYNGVGNAYLRCFFFATKTATSIGRNPKPENKYEAVFMASLWLMGVFVFAMLLGQMRDIVVTATAVENDYRFLVDSTINYMRAQHLPQELQDRVKLWFTYTWKQQRTLDELSITAWLPLKLKTDLAINVHIHTLSKVQLFKDCDATLLRDLVLKLRPVIFLPKDYIIRKGEVGKEMFIVLSGQVQVVGGENDEKVFVTLFQGSVFGEVSLLALAGNNRRTATIRSHGFSNLFVLSKDDLTEALEHHPDAKKIMQLKAQELVRASQAKTEEGPEGGHGVGVVIGNKVTPQKTPRLVKAVLQAVPSDSGTARLLQYGSGRSSQVTKLRRRRLPTTWEDSLSGDPDFDQVLAPVDTESSSGSFGSTYSISGEVRQSPTDDGNTSARTWSDEGQDEPRRSGSNSDLTIVVEDDNMFECRVTVHREMN